MAFPARFQRTDFFAALILLGLGIAGLIATHGFPARAAMWPSAVLTALVVASLALLVTSLRSRPGTTDHPDADAAGKTTDKGASS